MSYYARRTPHVNLEPAPQQPRANAVAAGFAYGQSQPVPPGDLWIPAGTSVPDMIIKAYPFMANGHKAWSMALDAKHRGQRVEVSAGLMPFYAQPYTATSAAQMLGRYEAKLQADSALVSAIGLRNAVETAVAVPLSAATFGALGPQLVSKSAAQDTKRIGLGIDIAAGVVGGGMLLAGAGAGGAGTVEASGAGAAGDAAGSSGLAELTAGLEKAGEKALLGKVLPKLMPKPAAHPAPAQQAPVPEPAPAPALPPQVAGIGALGLLLLLL